MNVASTSKERIGDFHLVAYEIIQKGLPMLVTHEPTKELIGVNMPGVNLRLTSSNETIGVIGVSGNPDEVTELAKLVKLTFETMYEYEYKKNLAVKGKSGVWNFAHALLNETPLNQKGSRKTGISGSISAPSGLYSSAFGIPQHGNPAFSGFCLHLKLLSAPGYHPSGRQRNFLSESM